MWLYLGLVTVTGSLILYLYQKLAIKSALQLRNTPKHSLNVNNMQIRYLLINSTSKSRGLFVIEIPCLSTLQFSARQELRQDKWAKRLGVSYEFETGAQAFDEQTYIASVTQEDAEIIGTNEDIIAAIRHLIFNNQYANIITKRTLIICDGKHLHVEMHFQKGSIEQNINTLASNFLPKLNALAKPLNTYKREVKHFWKVPAQRNTAIFLAISSALATWGALEAARFFFLDKNALFSPISLMPEAGVIASLALLSFIFLAFRLIKKSARRHLILIDMLIFGGLGLLFTVYGLLYDFNTMNDNSEPSVVSYEIISKYSVVHRGRKGRTYYTYHVDLKDAQYPIESSTKIDVNFYNSINQKDWISFTVRDGRLHKPWLENMYQCVFCKDRANDY